MWHLFKVSYRGSNSYGSYTGSFGVSCFGTVELAAQLYVTSLYSGLNQIEVRVVSAEEFKCLEARYAVETPIEASEHYIALRKEEESIKQSLRKIQIELEAIEQGITPYVGDKYRVIGNVLWMRDPDEEKYRSKALDLDVKGLSYPLSTNQAGIPL